MNISRNPHTRKPYVMANDQTLLPWVLATVGTVVGALATVIAKLYHSQIAGYIKREGNLESQVATLQLKVDSCEREHTEAKVVVAKLETRLSLLEGKVERL